MSSITVNEFLFACDIFCKVQESLVVAKTLNANMDMYFSFGNVITRACKKICSAYKLILSKLRNEVIAKKRVFTVTLNYNSVA